MKRMEGIDFKKPDLLKNGEEVMTETTQELVLTQEENPNLRLNVAQIIHPSDSTLLPSTQEEISKIKKIPNEPIIGIDNSECWGNFFEAQRQQWQREQADVQNRYVEGKKILTLEGRGRLTIGLNNDRCISAPPGVHSLETAIRYLAQSPYQNEAVLLLNEAELRENVRFFQDNLLAENSNQRQILYAVKANPQKRILDILADSKIDGFDCASVTEVDAALIAGAKPKNIYYNLPKPPSLNEVAQILDRQVRYLTVDHPEVLKKILNLCDRMRLNETPEIAVRIAIENPNAAVPMHSKFGVLPENYFMVIKMLRSIKKKGMRAGLCFHVGSQTDEPQIYEHAISIAAGLAKQAGGVNSINCGGGIPVDYYGNLPHDKSVFVTKINQTIAQHVDPEVLTGPDARIMFEFGRSLIAPCVTWTAPVSMTEQRREKRCLWYPDGVHGSFNGIKLHGWPVLPIGIFSPNGMERKGEPVEWTLYGQCCNPTDALETNLPADLQIGDRLTMANAGAYSDSYGSFFNGFCLPSYLAYKSS